MCLCMLANGSPGIVTVKKFKLFCVTCKKSFCNHAQFATQLTEKADSVADFLCQMLSDCSTNSTTTKQYASHNVYSKETVCFKQNSSITAGLNKLLRAEDITTLCPKLSCCDCGSFEMEMSTKYENAWLFTSSCIKTVTGETQ
jgi:hypothetical protein